MKACRYLPNCQTNLVIALYTLSLLFCKFINTTAYHLGRFKPSSPVSCRAPCLVTKDYLVLYPSWTSGSLHNIIVCAQNNFSRSKCLWWWWWWVVSKASSKIDQTGMPNFWLYAQCGWVRAARWHRWMKIEPAMYYVDGWSIQAGIRRACSFYLTRWLWSSIVLFNNLIFLFLNR